jgi:hypothetical protein
MTDANIIKPDGFTMTSPKTSTNFFETSIYLTRGKHYNNDIIERKLFSVNPFYSILRTYIVVNTKREATMPVIEALKVDLNIKWCEGIFNHHRGRQMIKDFILFGLLVRVSPRSDMYYYNPRMSHYLTVEQRDEYGSKYMNLFPAIDIKP